MGELSKFPEKLKRSYIARKLHINPRNHFFERTPIRGFSYAYRGARGGREAILAAA
ncbi:hypothetical protein KNP414_02376 [Paenibacillus mucilaginosus KNP414]|uniref:Uncharacterized protein n=1 Tax=Paenibacillus mucilaginosus (strain KNP414) TaxID=1036673 RepID=F8F5C6_PAEMK|nr:hypothetical protein KNP414_02376 [Paenibacillus mucilaginosus KNP414]